MHVSLVQENERGIPKVDVKMQQTSTYNSNKSSLLNIEYHEINTRISQAN